LLFRRLHARQVLTAVRFSLAALACLDNRPDPLFERVDEAKLFRETHRGALTTATRFFGP